MDYKKDECGWRWLKEGALKSVGAKKLNELNKNDMFIYKGMLCKVNIVSKYYVAFENEVLNQFNTTRVDQKVMQVAWTDPNARW